MTTQTKEKNYFVLKATCRAATGIVAGVSGFLADHGCYISELAQFDDEVTRNFFMRAVFRLPEDGIGIEQLQQDFVAVARSFGMDWQFHDASVPTRTLIMVSRQDHCLDDLLYRYRKQELFMKITAVVSNHMDLRPMVEREGIPFVLLPITKRNKARQEDRLLEVVRETGTELVILARYMQILSDKVCDALTGRCINIHHSFLPSFKGALPYHQAYRRGVKLIGATAHYVTPDLDEGPIIEQVVERVDHTYTANDLVAAGRDTECLALARAVKRHLEHRVFVDGHKTVVFR